jgi:predicted peroxiredoxin
MMTIKKSMTILAFLSMCIFATSSVTAADDGQRLFVNLTSDEINRATMAIVFGTRVLTEMNIPVTIHLTVEGTRIADRNIPAKTNANGDSLKGLLSQFMDRGGNVYVCGMCMNNVGGIKEDELIDGVKVQGGMSALFEPGTTVVSY